MAKKDFTLTSKLLLNLLAVGNTLSIFFPTPHELKRRALYGEWKDYHSLKSAVYYLKRKGLIQIIDKNARRFLSLTKKGELEALFVKARMPDHPKEWDGKWRLVIFDIPEEAKLKRDWLRRLLKKSGFYKIQGSVFASPYPLNRACIQYLKESGLINFIRLIKVEEMDNDEDLRKHFNLA